MKAKTTKQPWRMTKQEAGMEALRHDLQQARITLKRIPHSSILQEYIAGLEKSITTGAPATSRGHYYQVRHAIREGENVPACVLADYPSLVPTPEPTPTPCNLCSMDGVKQVYTPSGYWVEQRFCECPRGRAARQARIDRQKIPENPKPRPSNRPNVYKVKGLTGYQRHDDGPVYWFSGDVDTSRFEGVTRSGEGYKRL